MGTTSANCCSPWVDDIVKYSHPSSLLPTPSVGDKDHFYLNMEDEVVRGSCIVHKGDLIWPPPRPVVSAAPAKETAVKPVKAEPKEIDYFSTTLKDAFLYTTGLGTIVGLGVISPTPAFTTMVTTLGLSGIVGRL